MVVGQRQFIIVLIGMRAEGIDEFFRESRNEDRLGQVIDGLGEIGTVEIPDAVHEDPIALWQEYGLCKIDRGLRISVRHVFEDVVEHALFVVVG